ncbi:MAG: TIGR04282 family arsenosugar biosynthesis glycosyltransferase [Burkholderiales bacterium]|nr:TIGR04282 family arsenosugar biosynthesis glycosyltransferase [Burkholderiales bacterium]
MVSAQEHRAIVQVFAKAPQPGEVKTRLIPALGAANAAELHCRLVRHTLSTVAIARIGSTEIWTTPPGGSAFLQVCRRLLGLPLRMQPEGDVGERMSFAVRDGLARARFVLLLGTDVPGIHHEDLRAAHRALQEGADVVLGPAEDGGYWLIGLGRHDASVFDGIPWSTAMVVECTRQRLRALGWRWHELPARWDLDRPEDLQRTAADPRFASLLADLMQPA